MDLNGYEPIDEALNQKNQFIYERKVMLHGTVKLTADIIGIQNVVGIFWKRETKLKFIKLVDQKYKGSSCTGDHPVLHIHKVTKDDEDIYRYVYLTKDSSSLKYRSHKLKIVVIGGKKFPVQKSNLFYISLACVKKNIKIL